MVELSDPKGPVQEGIDNTIFIIPGIIVVSLISKSICHVDINIINYPDHANVFI